MPTWNDIRNEVFSRRRPDAARGDFDGVRRERLRHLHELTGRHVILYATDFINRAKVRAAQGEVTIDFTDKAGFVEVITNLTGKAVDIVLHSPGGSAEATESIVELLRSQFDSVRFIVPNIAKSAATMFALSGDELLLDERSELGPIDPQMMVIRDGQTIPSPAHAIRDQFEKAREEIAADPTNLPAWVPILRQYGPSLLAECDNAIDLAESLVSKWLATYMLKDVPDGEAKAKAVAAYLADRKNFLSHGRRIGIEEIKGLDPALKIVDLRDHPKLRDIVWQLYTATAITFDGTGAYKIIENELGEAYIRLVQQAIVQVPTQPPQPAPPPQVTPPA